jgi:arabinofuranosyltransferase
MGKRTRKARRDSAARPARSFLWVAVFAVFCLACFFYVLRFAWVAEDAYITFRVVDNFINGYGLRWNVAERVQVYTHPLWLLLHCVFTLFVGNIYRLTVVLSAVCGVAAVVLLCRLVPASPWHRALLVIAPLTLSRTFDDFVICGLENPLSFLTLAWLVFEWFRPEGQFRLFRFYFVAGLCLLTRLDNAVIIAPMLAMAAWQHRRQSLSLATLRAFSPLLAWSAFSLFYYGFVFPNTKYAKLNTGIPLSEYLVQGAHYLSSFVFYDFFGFVLIVIAIAIGVYQAIVLRDRRVAAADQLRPALLALGCVAQVAYVLWVGGDFMNGRFFANAVFIAVAVLFVSLRRLSPPRSVMVLLALIAVFGADHYVVRPSVKDPHDFNVNHGINNEREYYNVSTGLMSDPSRTFRLYPAGLSSVVIDENGANTPYVLGIVDQPQKCNPLAIKLFATNGVGLLGYCVGPATTIIDNMALTDPLLARLPITDPEHWRIGHFYRALPAGYWQAIKTGDSSGMDPAVARLWERLEIITRGDLWDMNRLMAIVRGSLEHPAVQPHHQSDESDESQDLRGGKRV